MNSWKSIYITAGVVFLATAAASFLFFSSAAGASLGLGGVVPDVEDAAQGPKTEECPLNGQLMTKGQRTRWEARRPLGVTVENHVEARPQSGLANADIIYEVVAEGGITRFLALYYCDDAKIVGPVRSARIYFVKLLQGYGLYPLYAHVGGANTPGPADALGEINDLGWGGYNDLNQFAVPFPIFYRDYDRLPGRATEHTMYASTEKLFEYAKESRDLTNKDKKGTAWDKGFEPWKFKDDAPADKRGAVTKINFGFWDASIGQYGVTFTYDVEDNSYRRSHAAAPHLDKNSGTPLKAKNVVIALVTESDANDGYEGGHLLYKVVGRGEALIFQDGNVIKGSWTKGDETEQMRFFDEEGTEVAMTRGKIFVEILPTGNEVTY